MSAAGLPYRLRPHKAVDRRIFLELLTRYERWQPLDGHAYVSMAAYTMEDQKLVHRLLGIQRLLAFDRETSIVDRQLFNRPTSDSRCVAADSTVVVSDLEGFVRGAGIEDSAGYIVWLDYTDPNRIRTQLGEFQQLAGQMAAGDIVKVTVNAAPGSWGANKRTEDREEGPALKELLRTRTYEKLRSRLGDFVAPEVTADGLDESELAQALARAFGLAANRAIRPTNRLALEPLSVVRYADGLQMLSVTAAMVERARVAELRAKLQLHDWAFGSASWHDVRFMAVPDLTVRERLYLERNAHLTAPAITTEVGFDFDEATGMPGFLDNYAGYYRHYPMLSPVEL